MKKYILSIIVASSLTAKADSFFDFPKFVEGAMLIVDSVNESLEKLRLLQKQKYDLTNQWNLMCESTQKVNADLIKLDQLMLNDKLDDKTCVPLANALQMQTTILANCEYYYSRNVQLNSDVLFEQFASNVTEVIRIEGECFPGLKKYLPSFQ